MKTLLLLRHAKSSWKDEGLADHDRPLNKRGKLDAPRMGEMILKLDVVPDVILSSTAKRARKTAQAVADACHFEGTIEKTRKLYFTDPSSWYELIREQSEDDQCVMLVGHNPGMEGFLEMITGYTEAMPTAALAHIEFDIGSWKQFHDGIVGSLVAICNPRKLDD